MSCSADESDFSIAALCYVGNNGCVTPVSPDCINNSDNASQVSEPTYALLQNAEPYLSENDNLGADYSVTDTSSENDLMRGSGNGDSACDIDEEYSEIYSNNMRVTVGSGDSIRGLVPGASYDANGHSEDSEIFSNLMRESVGDGESTHGLVAGASSDVNGGNDDDGISSNLMSAHDGDYECGWEPDTEASHCSGDSGGDLVFAHDNDSDNALGHTMYRPPTYGMTSKRGRVRRRRFEEWQQQVAKKKRNLGHEYTSHFTKKVVPARSVGPECRDGCFGKVGRDSINTIFASFWAIGDYNAQKAYLQGLIREVPVQRRRTTAEVSQRPILYRFFVRVGHQEVRVCRAAFQSIHGIGRRKVIVLLEKRKASPNVISIPDKRGHHPCSRAITGIRLERVHEHICSLPVTASHYSRAHSPHRRYMESGGTIAQLHNGYLLWMQENHPDEEAVSLRFYTTVFTTEYNIVFQSPKTDMCNTCELYQTRISNLQKEGCDTKEVEEAQRDHKIAAQVPRDLLRQSEQTAPGEADGDLRTIAIDLQQTLPCPRLRANKAYYKRKLWVFNFCIYDLCRKEPNMFIWDEVTGGRGADEVASCLLKWLTICQDRGDAFRKLRVYCDNCGGQNKNIFVLLMALQLVHGARLVRVEIVFMKSGHTYLPCDRAFGSIEKKIRRQAFVYSTQHYVDLISTAVKKGFPTVQMVRNDFLDFHTLLQNVTRRAAPQFAHASQLVVDSEYPEGYFIKNDYSPEDSTNIKKVRLMKGKGRWQREKFDLSKVALTSKYPCQRLLSSEKVTDLRSLLCLLDSVSRRWLEELCNKQDELRREACQVPVLAEELPDDPCNTTLDYCPLDRPPQ